MSLTTTPLSKPPISPRRPVMTGETRRTITGIIVHKATISEKAVMINGIDTRSSMSAAEAPLKPASR